MFFKREKARKLTFDDRIGNLRSHGFETQSAGSGKVKVLQKGLAALVVDGENGPIIADAGLAIGDGIAALVDGGYQKFFVTADGQRVPALAAHLRRLHDFTENLREGLSMTSLYNEGLGTTFEKHMYDRVKDRDRGVPLRPWQEEPTGH